VSSSSGLYHSDSHEPTSSSNFITSTNRISVAGSTHDNAGNQTYFAPYTLTFDAANRVTLAEIGTTDEAAFGYDGAGRRVKVWVAGGSGTTTYYIYDIAGRLAAEYTDGDPGTPERSYLSTDILGSLRAVTDSEGNVEECYDYTPFGRMLTEDDNGRSAVGCYPSSPATYTSDLEEKFTGQQRDETGLDYFIARYYADGQGRFTGADPLSGWPGDPQSWNRYAYARNNPLLYTDPNGLMFEICGSGGVCEDVSDSEFQRSYDSAGDVYATGNPSELGARGFLVYWEESWVGSYWHYSLDWEPPGDGQAEVAQGGAGGGGGGGGSTRQRVGKAVADALTLLPSSACSGLFNTSGTGMDAIPLLIALYSGISRYGSFSYGPLPGTPMPGGGILWENARTIPTPHYFYPGGVRTLERMTAEITINTDPAAPFNSATAVSLDNTAMVAGACP
jgi:RHS repeat-associated protein